jgi:WD40 repeat protein
MYPSLVLCLLSVYSAADGSKAAESSRDCYGDLLPAGAIARLGTVRLRHGDSISSLRFAPDGKTLISMGLDGVRVWDAATGKPVRSFGQGVFLRTFALSSDGRRIALERWHAGQGVPVEIWDVATGKLLHKMGSGHYSLLRFSPDGKQLAALGSYEPPGDPRIPWNISIWDAQTGRDIRTLTGPKEAIWDMAFSADGKALLLGGSGKAISLRSTTDGKELRRIRDLSADVHTLVLSPRGDRAAFIDVWMVSRGTGISVVLMDLQTGAVLRRWSVKPEYDDNGILLNGWSNLAFSPDGRRLAACQWNGPVRIWDTTSGAEKCLVPDGRIHAGGVAFSADGKTLAVGESGQLIRLIDAETGADRVPIRGYRSAVTAVALSGDGRTAFTADEEGTILHWDARSGRHRGRHLDLKSKVGRLILSPDGRTLFTRNDDKTLRAWDVASNEQQWRRTHPIDYRSRLALSPDGQMLAASYDDVILKIFNASTGEKRYTLPTKTPIWAVAFTADVSELMALTGRWTVRCWETASSRPLPDLTLPADAAEPSQNPDAWVAGELAVLSPDGRLAAHAFNDQILRILDVFGRRQIHRFSKLPGDVEAMAFASDGRSFVWAERSGVIHWLELSTGGERRTLRGHAGRVSQMVFDAGSHHLLSASQDTTALVWELFGQGSTTLSAEERNGCWVNLADKDAARAYRAMGRLLAAPSEALALLRSHLKPVEGLDERRLTRWVADLDADEFAARDKATEELQQLGDLAEPALRKALASRPTLEMRRRLQGLLDDLASWRPSLTIIRQLRAVEVLEHLGITESRRLLEALAKGAEGARQTREAKAAVQRLLRKN